MAGSPKGSLKIFLEHSLVCNGLASASRKTVAHEDKLLLWNICKRISLMLLMFEKTQNYSLMVASSQVQSAYMCNGSKDEKPFAIAR